MSLYNKCRPLVFDDMVGNRNTIQNIINHFKNPDHNHALLFTGETGCGKTTSARIVSRTLLNVGPDENLDQHLNYTEYNTALQRGVDTVRYIQKWFPFKGHGGGLRIYFLDECGSLTKEAQRGLLKLLEEIPKHNYVILSTMEPENLDDALIDRCAGFHLVAPNKQEIVELLSTISCDERKMLPTEILHKIATATNCRPRKAIGLLEKELPLAADLLIKDEEQVINNSEVYSESNAEQLPEPEDTEPVEPNSTELTSTIEATDKDGEVDEDVFQQPDEPEEPDSTEPTSANTPLVIFSATSELDRLESISCTSTELIRKELKPPKVYMHPFVTEAALIMIFAMAGVGKTMFALLFIVALTRKNGIGFKLGPLVVERLCGVLLLDGEMRPYDLQDRFKSLIGAMGEEHPDFPLVIMTSDDLFTRHGMPIDLADEQCRNAVDDFVNERPAIKMIVLDNLTSLILGMNENAKGAWDEINQWILRLRWKGIAVIVIHHANKSGDYSGHSAMIRNFDTVLKLTKQKSAANLCFKVDYTKSRTAKADDKQSFIIEAVQHVKNKDWLQWEYQASEQAPSEAEKAVKDNLVMAHAMLQKHSQAEIADMLGVSQPTVSNTKRQAVQNGYLTADGRITEVGQEFLKNVDLDDEE